MGTNMRRWLSFITFITCGGVVFGLSVKLGTMLFGLHFPDMDIWQLIVLGNINTFAFAFCAGVIGATMGVHDEETSD